MKNGRRVLFVAGTVAVLIAIAVLMVFIGRGHTVYFDNKTLEYGGQTYKAPYKIVVEVKGEQVAKLYDKERGLAVTIGPNFKMTLKVTESKGGEEKEQTYSFKLPHELDGVVVNLPGLMAGLPQEAYMEEFISSVEITPPEDTGEPADEFGIGTTEPGPAADNSGF